MPARDRLASDQALTQGGAAGQQIEMRRPAFPTGRQELELIGCLIVADADDVQTGLHRPQTLPVALM